MSSGIGKGSHKRNMSPKVGDVFEIPAPEGTRGLGQVVRAGGNLYVIIFSELFGPNPPLATLASVDILLAAWTTDALFFHGRWPVIGNYPIVEGRIPFPSYLVTINGASVVEDFDGMKRRLATSEDLSLLQYRATVAPIRLQNAFLARHGFGKWDPAYDALTAEAAWKRVLTKHETDDT